MRAKGNQNQEEEEYEDEEFGSRKDGPSSSISANNNNNNSHSNKDGKNNDKASIIRSKHSVTEQRRRSKINESRPTDICKKKQYRFVSELKYLLPDPVMKHPGFVCERSDQKRDTTSFILERNSHWRSQSFPGHSQSIQNGSSPGSTFPGKVDEGNISIHPAILTNAQNPVESEHSKDVCNSVEQQAEVSNKCVSMPIPLLTNTPVCWRSEALMHPLQQPVSDAHSAEWPGTSDALNQQDEFTVEAGTIRISSAYSQGLLNSLTQALQTAGVDLSQANISVQIDLGKRANRGLSSGIFAAKDTQSPHLVRDGSSAEEYDQAQKRQKT